MIEALLAVILRLTTFVEGRIKGRKEVFDRLLQPVFTQLGAIQADYLLLLQMGRALAATDEFTPKDYLASLDCVDDPQWPKDRKIGLRRAIAFLTKARLALEPVRDEVGGLVDALRSVELPSAELDFMLEVSDYLPTGGFGEDPLRMSKSIATGAIEQLKEIVDSRSESRDPATVFDELRDSQSSKYFLICRTFAQLKLEIAMLR